MNNYIELIGVLSQSSKSLSRYKSQCNKFIFPPNKPFLRSLKEYPRHKAISGTQIFNNRRKEIKESLETFELFSFNFCVLQATISRSPAARKVTSGWDTVRLATVTARPIVRKADSPSICRKPVYVYRLTPAGRGMDTGTHFGSTGLM